MGTGIARPTGNPAYSTSALERPWASGTPQSDPSCSLYVSAKRSPPVRASSHFQRRSDKGSSLEWTCD